MTEEKTNFFVNSYNILNIAYTENMCLKYINELLMKFTSQNLLDLEAFLWVKNEWGEIEKRSFILIQKYCSIFRYIPWLLFVWVGNSIAMNAAHKESDIDIFVITKSHALWFVRIIMTLILALTGMRKTYKKHAWKICLSFFCTEDALDFRDIAIEKDIYLYYRILTMKPILIKGDIYKRFIEENSWVDFSEFQNIYTHHSAYLSYDLKEGWGGNTYIKYIDSILKKMLLSRSIKKYEALGQPEGVIINDNMLKFHNTDKRKYIRENVLEKI